jgi:hypothetical protein
MSGRAKRHKEQFGPLAGAKMTIDERENEVVLKPVEHTAPLKLANGILVFTGTAKSELTDAVRVHREDRQRQVAGKKA